MTIETTSKIQIISDALILLGENPTSSLTDDRTGVTFMVNRFERVYENELQSNRWRFACTKGALSQLVSSPLNEWQYAYQLPADCLLPLGTYPSSRYELYGSRLYSNSSSVELEYLFKPAVSALPAYFAQLVTYALALEGARAISESDATVREMNAKYIRQRDRAMFADAQGRPNRSIVHSPFTAGRVLTQ